MPSSVRVPCLLQTPARGNLLLKIAEHTQRKRPRLHAAFGNQVDPNGCRYCFGGLLVAGLVAGGVAGFTGMVPGFTAPVAGLAAPGDEGGGAGTPDLTL